jgi:hypothetical protein
MKLVTKSKSYDSTTKENLCKFDTFLAKCEIRQTTVPYSPQNDVAEHVNGTIMVLAQGLELEFSGEVVNTTVYIKNRCLTKALDSKTPQEAWNGRKFNCLI